MRKIFWDIKEGLLLGLVIVSLLCSFFLFIGFTLGLPIILAVCFSPWWLLLLIITLPIGFAMLSVCANNTTEDYHI